MDYEEETLLRKRLAKELLAEILVPIEVKGPCGKAKAWGVLDSVPAWSPLIIKLPEGLIDIIPISDLADFSNAIKHGHREVVLLPEGVIEVFSMAHYAPHRGKRYPQWEPVKLVSRHWYEGEILRIFTKNHVVDVTPNHVLFGRGRRTGGEMLIRGEDAKPGTKIAVTTYPDTVETGWNPFFEGTKELAWFYGLFAAEGTVLSHAHKGSKLVYDGTEVRISNSDDYIIEKVEEILKDYYHQHIWKNESNGVINVCVKSKPLATYFRKIFYTSGREKRVPVSILNAPQEIKLEFLKGYFEGDGGTNGNARYEFQSFSTKSMTLAAGICWLLSTTRWQIPKIYKGGKYGDCLDINLTAPGTPRAEIEQQFGEVKYVVRIPYKGYVYDIETPSHRFTTGIGVRIHNTGATVSALMPDVLALTCLENERPGEVIVASGDVVKTRAGEVELKIGEGNCPSIKVTVFEGPFNLIGMNYLDEADAVVETRPGKIVCRRG